MHERKAAYLLYDRSVSILALPTVFWHKNRWNSFYFTCRSHSAPYKTKKLTRWDNCFWRWSLSPLDHCRKEGGKMWGIGGWRNNEILLWIRLWWQTICLFSGEVFFHLWQMQSSFMTTPQSESTGTIFFRFDTTVALCKIL